MIQTKKGKPMARASKSLADQFQQLIDEQGLTPSEPPILFRYPSALRAVPSSATYGLAELYPEGTINAELGTGSKRDRQL